MTPDNMEKCIDAAIGYGSYKKVHEYLMNKMKEEYEYLNKLFETQKETSVEEKTEQNVEKPVEKPIENAKADVSGNNVVSQPNEKKPVKKKAKDDTIGNVDTSGNDVGEQKTETDIKENVDNSGNVVANSGSENDVKLDAKQKQKMKQDATRARLEKEGKSPKDMLTEANLRRWIVDEKKSFAKIAADYVGCTEQEVSVIARQFELESPYSGRRGVIVGKMK